LLYQRKDVRNIKLKRELASNGLYEIIATGITKKDKLAYADGENVLISPDNNKETVIYPYGDKLIRINWRKIAIQSGYSREDIDRLAINFELNYSLYNKGLELGNIALTQGVLRYDKQGLPHVKNAKGKDYTVSHKPSTQLSKKKVTKPYPMIRQTRVHQYAQAVTPLADLNYQYHHVLPWLQDWLQGASLLLLVQLSPSEHAKITKLLARFDKDIRNYLVGSSRYAISYTIRQGQTVK
jgi:hypothetical protein